MPYRQERADIRFRVCEGEYPSVFLGTEENGPETNTILHNELDVYLHFKDGVDFNQAKAIAAYLNQYIKEIAVVDRKNAS